MSVADAIRKAQEADKATDKRRPVEVPRWGVTVYLKPVTSHHLTVLTKKHPDFQSSPSQSALIDMMMLLAETEDGEKMFDGAEDKLTLMAEPVDVVNSVLIELNPNTSIEDAEKN